MNIISDQALVLRTHKLAEADRIITLLTAGFGQRRAVARSVRKTSSRFGARLEIANLIRVQLYTGRSLDKITQVTSENLYGAEFMTDYERYTAANAMCEAAYQLTETDHNPRHFLLLKAALKALSQKIADPPMLRDSYLLRALALSGWQMQIRSCAHCEKPGKFQHFSAAAGGALCPADADEQTPAVTSAQLELLDAVYNGSWQLVNAAPAALKNWVSAQTHTFLQWQLDKTLKSLQVLSSTKQ